MLGAGAFGSVWLFESRDDPDKKFAVKIMQKSGMRPSDLAMLREEISILSVLDHINIITYVESYEDQRYIYIVMEHFKQCSELAGIIEKRTEEMEQTKNEPLLAEETVRAIMHMLFKGLSHIHTNGIVHRDLKTENCLIDSDNNLRIIDFGLSKASSQK